MTAASREASTVGALGRLKRPLLFVMGPAYVVAGVMHFVVPAAYVQVMPPVLPAPLALVYLSGVAEVALGVGVLYPRTRRYAAWGLVALLVAVFPANVYMATSGVAVQGTPFGTLDPSAAERWGRLPLQAVLVAWAWWYARPTGEE